MNPIIIIPARMAATRLPGKPLADIHGRPMIAHVLDRGHIRLRVWERGAGLTKACGTGACAAQVAAVRRGLTDRKATVVVDGGELTIDWDPETDHVLMTGPVEVERTGALAF